MNEIALEHGVRAFSCILHLCGTLRNNFLQKGHAIPVFEKTIFDHAKLNGFQISDARSFNCLRFEISKFPTDGAIVIKMEGKTLLAVKTENGDIRFDGQSSTEEDLIGSRFDNDNFSFTIFRQKKPISEISMAVSGDFDGTLKLGVIQEFGMDVLQEIPSIDHA